MTSLTFLTLAVVVLGMFTRLGLPRALAIGGATSTGAAFALNDRVVISTFAAVAVVGVAWSVLGSANRAGKGLPAPTRPIPGALPLVLFGLWTTVITAVGASIFQGTPVLDASGNAVPLGSAGLFTVSNLAQLLYLWLGIAVVFLVARDRSSSAGVIWLGLTIATLLNFWALLHRDVGMPFPERFFDNATNFRFIDSAPGGVVRFRGIMAEPSAIAAVAVPTLVFAIASFPYTHGWRRLWKMLIAVLALWIGIVSTSTSFVISGVALVAAALLVFCVRLGLRRLRVSALFWVATCAVSIAMVFLLPGVLNALAATLSAKVDSSSYAERSSADSFSFALALQTFGVGVGVGSNRPSSFAAALLSQTGVLGFALFAVAVLLILRTAIHRSEARPVLWVAVSLLLGKAFNGPDLGDSTGLTWLVLGVLASYSVRGAEVERTAPAWAESSTSRAQPRLVQEGRR